MRLSLIPALCALASLCPAAPVQWSVGSGGNGHWYDIVRDSNGDPYFANWQDQNAAAIAAGGYLVSITSAAENAFVHSLTATVLGYYYIGLTDDAVEGVYVWTSGEPATYFNWAPNEPNNFAGPENFSMYWSTTGLPVSDQWNDTDGTFPYYGLMEWNSDPSQVPEPGSALLLGGGALALYLRRRAVSK